MLTEIFSRLVPLRLWFVAGSASLLVLANLFIDTYRGNGNEEFSMLQSPQGVLVGA